MTDPIVIEVDVQNGCVLDVRGVPAGYVVHVRDFDTDGTVDAGDEPLPRDADGDPYMLGVWVPDGDCPHDNSEMMENGNIWCRACQSEVSYEDGTIVYQEPTSAQFEAMNNPDSGPSGAHYRDSMRDSGRGGMLR